MATRNEIEVWSLETGERMRKISDPRPIWLFWAISLFGTMAWSMSWLWTGRNVTNTAQIVGDLSVVSVLAMAAFYLRMMYGGMQFQLERPSVIGALWFLIGMTTLTTVWLIFGRMRWSFRIPAALVGLIGIWAGPLALWEFYGFQAQGMTIGCLMIAFFVAMIGLWLRRRGWRLVLPDQRGQPGNASRFQWPLVDLFFLPLAIGLVIVVSKLIPFPQGIPVHQWIFYVLLSLTQAVIVIIAFWAAFSTRKLWFRIGLGSVLVLVISASLRTIYWNIPMSPIWWHIVLQTGVAIYVFAALVLVRRAGWALGCAGH